jgi:hypothetical protein
MKKVTLLLLLLLLSSCTGSNAQHGSIKAPWDEWYFTFTTPKALPAEVTLVKVLDTDGYGYGFRTIDQPQGSSVGIWNERKSRGIPNFNKADAPPQLIQFCWDSIIDKKVYETTLFFAPDTWQLMITPYPDVLNPKEKYYRRAMIIGLAPQGVVRVWLQEYGRSDIPLTSTKIKTVSGSELDMCKGITSFPNGYGYTKSTQEFIKDKKYPYGNW